MGGNALKEIYTRRYDKEEYEDLFIEIQGIIFHPNRLDLIPSYKNKSSFGDMDLLLEVVAGDEANYYTLIQRLFNPSQMVKNGNVISFDYKELQIDVILMKTVEYDCALNYYSFNDLGNLIGKLAHNSGLKYGHRGLSHTVRDDNHNPIGSVLISRDTRVIYNILGLDFDEMDIVDESDIFDFVVSSRYFHPKFYLRENLNHRTRVRDLKRVIYSKFMDYCYVLMCEYNYKPLNIMDTMDKVTYDHIMDSVRELVSMDNLLKTVKYRLNGKIVRDILGIEGKELGMFMKYLHRLPNYQCIVLTSCDHTIEKFISDEFRCYNGF